MGKVDKFTGSAVLGSELKRLRGTRTLAEISRLTKEPPLSDRIKPISAPTLCQIESGQTMPTLDTLHSLATVFHVNPQRLYDLIVEDRLVSSASVPDTLDGCLDAYRSAVRAGEFERGLAIAIHAEMLAQSAADEVTWRSARAACLGKLGMRQDAIWLLHECLDDPAADQRRRFTSLVNLASAYSEAGLLTPAAACAQQAQDLTPDDLPDTALGSLLRVRASILIQQADGGADQADRLAGEALRLLERAARFETDAATALGIRLEKAVARQFVGNALLAATELTCVAEDAGSAGLKRIEMMAAANLGLLRKRQDRMAEAERHLNVAESLLTGLNEADAAFEIHFELYRLAQLTRSTGKQRRHRKRCERWYPLVTARTPNVRRFEQLLRSAK